MGGFPQQITQFSRHTAPKTSESPVNPRPIAAACELLIICAVDIESEFQFTLKESEEQRDDT
jgi:hypothetical protein